MTLILARPRHGVVPSVIGMQVPMAVKRLERLKLQPAVEGGSAVGRVIRQEPRGGRVAAAPGMLDPPGRSGRLRNGEPARP